MMRDRFDEARAIALQGWLIAKRGGRAWRDKRVDPDAPHVVFVHGYFAAGPVFDPLRKAVLGGLGAPTLDLTYGPHRDFESIAAELGDRIQREVEAQRRVLLVGHSLGGLLARWYVQEQGGRAIGLVTLATPHGGTNAAKRVPGSLARALDPRGKVLRRLGNRVGIPHLAIAGGKDRVVPTSSALAVEDADVAVYDHLGHNTLLYDAEVHGRVVRALEDMSEQ